MDEVHEKLEQLEDYEILELFKKQLDNRFENNQYELGFEAKRQTDAFIIGLKLLMDSYHI